MLHCHKCAVCSALATRIAQLEPAIGQAVPILTDSAMHW